MWREEGDGGARERNGGVTERDGGSREKDGSSSERDGSASERDGDERERNAAGKKGVAPCTKRERCFGRGKTVRGNGATKNYDNKPVEDQKDRTKFCLTIF